MIVHQIHDLTNNYVINLLSRGLSNVTQENILKNYHPDFKNEDCNLFYILKNGRYHNGRGKYYVLEEQGTYMASTGWNEYHHDPLVALVLTRMYIIPEHRGKYLVGKHILPGMIAEVYNYPRIWMTVNHYNKQIYNWVERHNRGQKAALFNDWPDIYKKFKPRGMMNINNTAQWVSEYDKGISDD